MASKLEPAHAKLLGAQLKIARQSLSLAIQDIANRCDMHHSQLSRLERGQFKRLSKNVQNVCSFLHIKPHESVAPGPGSGVAQLHARLDVLVSRDPGSAEILAALLDVLDTWQRRA